MRNTHTRATPLHTRVHTQTRGIFETGATKYVATTRARRAKNETPRVCDRRDTQQVKVHIRTVGEGTLKTCTREKSDQCSNEKASVAEGLTKKVNDRRTAK